MNNMQNDNQNNTQIKRGRGRPKMDKNIPKQNEKKNHIIILFNKEN